MLSDSEKQRLFEEEEYRIAAREELQGRRGPSSLRERLFAFLNSNVGAWFLGTVVVAGFGFMWTRYQENVTAEQRRIVEQRTNAQRDTELVIGLLPHLAQNGSPVGSLALGMVRHLRETRGIDAALSDILDAILADIARANVHQASAEGTNPEAKRQHLETAEAAAATIDKQAGPQDAALWRDLPQRAYVHVPSETERVKGESIQTKVRGLGLLAPGVQNVGGKAPDKTEVRYFNDADKRSAEEIAKQIGGSAKKPKLFARQGQIEIWVGAK